MHNVAGHAFDTPAVDGPAALLASSNTAPEPRAILVVADLAVRIAGGVGRRNCRTGRRLGGASTFASASRARPCASLAAAARCRACAATRAPAAATPHRAARAPAAASAAPHRATASAAPRRAAARPTAESALTCTAAVRPCASQTNASRRARGTAPGRGRTALGAAASDAQRE